MGDLSGRPGLLDGVRDAARQTPASGIIAAVSHGRGKEGLIPLWAGEGDLPTPRVIVEAATAALEGGETFYTYDRGVPELREALAGYYGRLYGGSFEPASFFVTGSGMQAIQISLALTVGAGEEIIVPTPSWPNVMGAATVLGATPRIVPMRDEGGRFRLDVDDLADAVTDRTRALFINSPANPTGWTADRETLSSILALARRHGVWIIADEIYARFVWTGERRSASFLDVAEPTDRVLYVNTFSKNWAMTGWRMGWIHAPPELGQTVANLTQYSTSGVAPFMQRAGVTALNEMDWFIDHMVARSAAGRQIVADALGTSDRVRFVPPDGAFYAFFKVDGLESSREAAFRLIDEARVGTAPGTAFGDAGEGYVRVCFARSAPSLREAMNRIVEFIHK